MAPSMGAGPRQQLDMPEMTSAHSEAAAVPTVLPHPSAPLLFEETGLSLDLLLQLALKHMHFAGELTGSELARRLGLRFTAIEPAVHALKHQHQIEIVGGSMVGPASYRYRITDAGRTRVTIFLEHNQYVGFAPVPLARYTDYLKAWKQAAPRSATRTRVREAFQHLVLGQRVLDQLGPAINAGHSLFVYGPPGNGKSVISQAIRNLLDGDIAIPHAVEIEGQIVRLFDPVQHDVLTLPEGDGLADEAAADKRWVRCRRPLVTVGGELTLNSLELSYNAATGFYHAPVQAAANGGVLVIDDFGRQQVEPRQFLNRWIVPLESRVDFLTLQTGQKFELPFAVLLVFATNLQPWTLVDEAFLRRIHNKVFAESPTAEQFCAIFETCCGNRGVPYDRAVVEHLLSNYFRPRAIPLRGCQPRDLIDQALSLAEYLAEPRLLTTTLLEAACDGYFVEDSAPAPTYA
jgi:predicted ATPase with chaperone activity